MSSPVSPWRASVAGEKSTALYDPSAKEALQQEASKVARSKNWKKYFPNA